MLVNGQSGGHIGQVSATAIQFIVMQMKCKYFVCVFYYRLTFSADDSHVPKHKRFRHGRSCA